MVPEFWQPKQIVQIVSIKLILKKTAKHFLKFHMTIKIVLVIIVYGNEDSFGFYNGFGLLSHGW